MNVRDSMDSMSSKENGEDLTNTVANEVDDSVSVEDEKEVLRTVEVELTESTDSEDGNPVKEQVNMLEMKTFKRYFRSLSQDDRLEETTEEDPVKIVCVGSCTGEVSNKGVFIKDYLGIKPAFRIHPFNSIDFYLKRVNWRRRDNLKNAVSLPVVLQLCEISDLNRLSAMAKVFLQHSQGAMVFWAPRYPDSLKEAVYWRKKIKQDISSRVPCVLVTENLLDSCANSVCWIGPGKVFESELKLDQFSKEHEFADHFEIKSRDWVSREKSVFGKAVNCLLDEIFEANERENKTWM
ncbi:uncharacterized protein [Montipora capricornis]|uniref:uncharacterized protein n=1 Tax=Montipora capricornis TaxID=246305 RepID=UPI0035F1BEF3